MYEIQADENTVKALYAEPPRRTKWDSFIGVFPLEGVAKYTCARREPIPCICRPNIVIKARTVNIALHFKLLCQYLTLTKFNF